MLTLAVTPPEIICLKFEEDMKIAADARSSTGVLAIHPRARDIKIDGFSITYHGAEMLKDTKLELSCGNRFVIIPCPEKQEDLFACLISCKNICYLSFIY